MLYFMPDIKLQHDGKTCLARLTSLQNCIEHGCKKALECFFSPSAISNPTRFWDPWNVCLSFGLPSFPLLWLVTDLGQIGCLKTSAPFCRTACFFRRGKAWKMQDQKSGANSTSLFYYMKR